MYKKVLVANRGEIALRIIRTLREMGIASIAIYSDADRRGRFVLEANEAHRVGASPAADSYLNIPAIISIAKRAGADAVHPGYGFLSENPDFAEAVNAEGIAWIGPSAATMRLTGDKIEARRRAQAADVPVVPGTAEPVRSIDQAREFVARFGLPVLVKAGGGGGGRGIRLVPAIADLEEALNRASREAETFFRNPDVYLERFYRGARHIEVQVVGDQRGRIEAWGERDCSVQRRRQKLIEETPAPGLEEEDRRRIHELATRFAGAAQYVGLGTVEFLYAGPNDVFLLEMNARIQVEHPVTEMVTGGDLVREGVLVTAGERATEPPVPRGHAIEGRINAEDPARGFAAGPGQISRYVEPGGPGVRVDSGVYAGYAVPPDYDSLMAKIVVHSAKRTEAVARLIRACAELQVEGVPTTAGLIGRIAATPEFVAGAVTTDWLDDRLSDLVGSEQAPPEPQNEEGAPRVMDIAVNGKRFSVAVYDQSKAPRSTTRPARRRESPKTRSGNVITSPMHGTVLALRKSVGDEVKEGEPVAVVEAMKMENEIVSPRDGRILAFTVSVGDTIEVNQVLAKLQ